MATGLAVVAARLDLSRERLRESLAGLRECGGPGSGVPGPCPSGEAEAPKVGRKLKAVDPAANRPTQPHERHKGKTPPVKPYEAPPEPRAINKGSGKSGGFAAGGKTNTEIGDLGEAAMDQLGFRSILPEGERRGPMDLEYNHSGHAFELKVCTTDATEYKVKLGADEVASKPAFSRKHKLTPHTMILVMDLKTKTAMAYHRPGIGSFSLNPKNPGPWKFAGKVKL